MIIVISPSKTLDYEKPVPIKEYTQPALLNQSATLIESCKTLSEADIASLMKVSPQLARLSYERFQQWQSKLTLKNARQAIFAFKGDVYEGLHVDDFSSQDFQFAQQHLRILSGLYGLLRPLDLMLPYRLEMGTALKNGNNKNLYQFWGDKITTQLHQETLPSDKAIINLSSNEYFKSIKTDRLKLAIIHPIFLDESKDQYKTIGFYAKKARGLMSRYIIKNQLTDIKALQSFNLAGYHFDKNRSSQTEWVFKRSQQDAIKAKNER